MNDRVDEIVLETCKNHHHLFEAFSSRHPLLKKIDTEFAVIKKNPKNSHALRKLTRYISQFIEVPIISFKVKPNSYTYSVFPIYNDNLPSIFRKQRAPVGVHKYVKRVYFIVGEKIIDLLTHKELTAILLHELGHVEEHTSLLASILPSVIGGYSDRGTTIGLLAPIIGVPLLIASSITSHVARFFDRMEEYRSDNFAAANGYGEEMARVLYKMKKIDDANKLKKGKKMGKIEKMKNFVMSILYPKEHPSDKKRICVIINKMIDDYKKQYPDLKKDMHVIFSDLKCR